MVAGVDTAISLSKTYALICRQLGIENFPVVVCDDSFSLYECLVKLGTTKEKRLMIDIMASRQSYERRELAGIRWIEGNSNPADAMTKSTQTGPLSRWFRRTCSILRFRAYVQRSNGSDESGSSAWGEEENGAASRHPDVLGRQERTRVPSQLGLQLRAYLIG